MGVTTARCLAVILSMWLANFSNSQTLAFPSTALPDIASGNYGFKFPNTAISAWFISCTPVISILGSFAFVRVLDQCGRKMALMLMFTLNAIGWMTTACSNGITWMFVGRVLVSLSDTSQQSSINTVLSEIAPKEIRGKAIYFALTGFMTGLPVSYMCGTFVSWRWLSVVAIGIELATITSVWLFVPETPRWLIMNGDRELAVDNLKKLRQHSTNFEEKIEAEICEMEHSLGINESTSFCTAIGRLVNRPLLHPFILVNIAMLFQQFSASSYIKSFMVNIFKMSSTGEDFSNNGLLSNPHYQSILVGVCGIVGTLLTAPAADRLGRRTCFIISGSVVTVSLSAMAIYFWCYRASEQWAAATIGWLPLVALMCFNIGYGIGYCPGPTTIGNEMFPTTVRATGMLILGVNHSVGYFIVVQLFGGFDIEPHIMFTTYASIGVIGVLFFVFFLPETKNRTLEDIEKFWIKENTKQEISIS